MNSSNNAQLYNEVRNIVKEHIDHWDPALFFKSMLCPEDEYESEIIEITHYIIQNTSSLNIENLGNIIHNEFNESIEGQYSMHNALSNAQEIAKYILKAIGIADREGT